MPQFLIEKNIRVGESITIDDADAHHIIDVLRLKKEDWIVLSDGKGSRFKAEIEEIGKRSLTASIQEKLPDICSSKLTLAQAVIKHDRTEMIIQKAVELGVAEIIPFTSERTIPIYSDGVPAKKIERWNKIAVEASKQCGLAIKPVVGPIKPLIEVMKYSKDYEDCLMFYEGEEILTLADHFKNRGAPFDSFAQGRQEHKSTRAQELQNSSTPVLQHPRTLILIGPEGGFTHQEVDLARGHGFTTVKLGPLIMRVETAATTAIALTQYFLGHFS